MKNNYSDYFASIQSGKFGGYRKIIDQPAKKELN